jgi:hypothetical protein
MRKGVINERQKLTISFKLAILNWPICLIWDIRCHHKNFLWKSDLRMHEEIAFGKNRKYLHRNL